MRADALISRESFACAAHGALLLSCMLLHGCAVEEANPEVVVRIDPAQVVQQGTGTSALEVRVSDVRQAVKREKTSLGIRIGTVRFDPAEVELVRHVVEAAASEAGVSSPGVLWCGIRVFDLETPSTPLYWDVGVKVSLVIRLAGRDREVSASASERTWVYPTREIIGRVATDALRQVSAQARTAIAELSRLGDG
jgi:hypothetical protein